MNDGNPSLFREMINFDKLRMMANRVREIASLMTTTYPYEKISPIQNYLTQPPIEMNLNKLKDESLKCEPAEK